MTKKPQNLLCLSLYSNRCSCFADRDPKCQKHNCSKSRGDRVRWPLAHRLQSRLLPSKSFCFGQEPKPGHPQGKWQCYHNFFFLNSFGRKIWVAAWYKETDDYRQTNQSVWRVRFRTLLPWRPELDQNKHTQALDHRTTPVGQLASFGVACELRVGFTF